MTQTTAWGPIVAVINTSDEVITMLEMALQDEGFRVVGQRTTTTAFKREELNLTEFLTHHDPQAVVWDIAPPYEENWKFFMQALALPVFEGRGVVLTTTNKRVLDGLVGPTDAIEIVGKPFDLEEIVQAVRTALARVSA